MSSNNNLLAQFFSGSVGGLLLIFRCVSFASVYFSQTTNSILEPHLKLCLNSLILSSAISQGWYILRGPVDGSILCCASSTAVPFYTKVAAIGASLVLVQGSESETTNDPSQSHSHMVLFLFSLISILYAIAVWTLGRGGQNALFVLKQAFPSPVLFGFFAVVGTSIIESAIGMVAVAEIQTVTGLDNDIQSTLSLNLPVFLASCCGVINRGMARTLPGRFWVLPMCLIVELVMFYIGLEIWQVYCRYEIESNSQIQQGNSGSMKWQSQSQSDTLDMSSYFFNLGPSQSSSIQDESDTNSQDSLSSLIYPPLILQKDKWQTLINASTESDFESNSNVLNKLQSAITSLILCLLFDIISNVIPLEGMFDNCVGDSGDLNHGAVTIDMARELRVGGEICFISGLFGGSISYLSLSPTKLVVDAGGGCPMKLKISDTNNYSDSDSELINSDSKLLQQKLSKMSQQQLQDSEIESNYDSESESVLSADEVVTDQDSAQFLSAETNLLGENVEAQTAVSINMNSNLKEPLLPNLNQNAENSKSITSIIQTKFLNFLNFWTNISLPISGLSAFLLMVIWLIFDLSDIVLPYIPKFWVAGLLLHLGFGYFLDGTYDAWQWLDTNMYEHYIVITIIILGLVLDITYCVFIGLIISSGLFIYRYSKEAVKTTQCYWWRAHSNSNRSLRYRTYSEQKVLELLTVKKKSILIVRPRTYNLFFGSVGPIIDTVKNKINSKRQRQQMGNKIFIVFDLKSTKSLDANAILSLSKLNGSSASKANNKNQQNLIFTNLDLNESGDSNHNDNVKTQIVRCKKLLTAPKLFQTLEAGLEWCEDVLLAAATLNEDCTTIVDRESKCVTKNEFNHNNHNGPGNILQISALSSDSDSNAISINDRTLQSESGAQKNFENLSSQTLESYTTLLSQIESSEQSQLSDTNGTLVKFKNANAIQEFNSLSMPQGLNQNRTRMNKPSLDIIAGLSLSQISDHKFRQSSTVTRKTDTNQTILLHGQANPDASKIMEVLPYSLRTNNPNFQALSNGDANSNSRQVSKTNVMNKEMLQNEIKRIQNQICRATFDEFFQVVQDDLDLVLKKGCLSSVQSLSDILFSYFQPKLLLRGETVTSSESETNFFIVADGVLTVIHGSEVIPSGLPILGVGEQMPDVNIKRRQQRNDQIPQSYDSNNYSNKTQGLQRRSLPMEMQFRFKSDKNQKTISVKNGRDSKTAAKTSKTSESESNMNGRETEAVTTLDNNTNKFRSSRTGPGPTVTKSNRRSRLQFRSTRRKATITNNYMTKHNSKVSSKNNPNSKMNQIYHLSAGDFYGESHLKINPAVTTKENTNSPVRIIAELPSQILTLSRDSLFRMQRDHPLVALMLFKGIHEKRT